jgi:predicted PurR-regulated permease PerM
MTIKWNTFTKAVVVSVSLIVLGWIFYIIWPIIDPLIISALLAYVLNPLVKLLQNRTRLNRRWVVPIVYFSGLILLITIPSALTPLAIKQVKILGNNLANIETQLETGLAEPLIFAGQQFHLDQMMANFFKTASESLTPVTQGTLKVLEATSTSLIWLLVILVSLYYFLQDGDKLVGWFVRLFPENSRPDLRRLLQEVDLVWQAYMRGTLVLMIVVALVFTIIWTAIGLPGAIALGLLAGLLTVIPDIGPSFVALLAVLVAFFQGSNFLPLSNFWFAMLVFGSYFILIQFKSIWLRPFIMKSFLHLNEGVIFVSIIAATLFWGLLGALVIVPLLATLIVVGRYVRSRLLDLEPWPNLVPSLPEQKPTDDSPASPRQ